MKEVTIPLEEWEKTKEEAAHWKALYSVFLMSDLPEKTVVPVVWGDKMFSVRYLGLVSRMKEIPKL